MTKDKLVEGGEWEVDGTPPAAAPATAVPLTAGKPSESPGEDAVRGKLQEDADAAIKDYFDLLFRENHFDRMFGSDFKFPDSAKTTLAIIAPRGLYCRPHTSGSTNNYVKYELRHPGKEHLRAVLRNLGGEYTEQLTDIYDDGQFLDSLDSLEQLVPELSLIKGAIKTLGVQFHDYTAVLSMDAKLRDLPALAIKNRQVPNIRNSFGDIEVAIQQFNDICIPTFREIVEVAGQYGVRQVRPVLEALKEVEDQYRAVWLQQ